MFEGFIEDTIEGAGASLFVRYAGAEGRLPLVLLHGYPQTSAMWHQVAPLLANDFRVICPDLRGYGRSTKPASDDRHAAYSKRAMANDIVRAMENLGHDTFFIGAHDRGARVAHRLGLDHPERVRAMTLLDIAPTREMFGQTSASFATAYWHWFFLIQKYPLPEDIIGKDPAGFWKKKCFNQTDGDNPFDPSALEEYLTAFQSAEAIHASCEDYRAAASIDIEHDNADCDRRLDVPLRVYWAKRGVIEKCFDALALWQQRASNVSGEALNATHYMAEEIPQEIAMRMQAFFAQHS
ncbi:MAG: alpha/beta hydrolase [Hyphomicrobiales bacterium]|nr:alpha/beta hydrolase [Hyphomicrobiales bacterium]